MTTWTNGDDLVAKVMLSLINAIKVKPRPGWVRGDTIASKKALSELNEANHTIKMLNDKLRDPNDDLEQFFQETDLVSFDVDYIQPSSNLTRQAKIYLVDLMRAIGYEFSGGISEYTFDNILHNLASVEAKNEDIDLGTESINNIKTYMFINDIITIQNHKATKHFMLTSHGTALLKKSLKKAR